MVYIQLNKTRALESANISADEFSALAEVRVVGARGTDKVGVKRKKGRDSAWMITERTDRGNLSNIPEFHRPIIGRGGKKGVAAVDD